MSGGALPTSDLTMGKALEGFVAHEDLHKVVAYPLGRVIQIFLLGRAFMVLKVDLS